jgi:RimJ/RimL family protein N-acetyltransferase
MAKSEEAAQPGVRLVAWGREDLPLLERLLGDPRMMEYLGGPESREKIAERQARYQRMETGVFKVVDTATGVAAGWVGYWEREWRDEQVYEIGWSVLPEFQGRGIARSATAQATELARAEARCDSIHAFPSVKNRASNAICARLGFKLLEECDFEYPPGNLMRCNDWRLPLTAATKTAAGPSR